VAEQWTEQ